MTVQRYIKGSELDVLHKEFELAYLAFVGAFDTPQMRRAINNEYADDARTRLRDFAEHLSELNARSV